MKTMTYGQLPDDLLTRFEKAHPYYFNLRGDDAETASRVGIPDIVEPHGVEPEEMVEWTQALVKAWESGDDAAGDLASGFLTTLDVEWI